MKKQIDNNSELILDSDYNSLIEEKENFAEVFLDPAKNNPKQKQNNDVPEIAISHRGSIKKKKSRKKK